MIIKVDKDNKIIATEKCIMKITHRKRYTNFNILRAVAFLVFTFTTVLINSKVNCKSDYNIEFKICVMLRVFMSDN